MDTENDRNDCIRTTIYLPRYLYEEAKMMAVFTRSSVSALMRIAIKDKINSLKLTAADKRKEIE